jgi:plasmid stability protein
VSHDLTIDVSDEIADELEKRAARNGRTAEAEHRAILEAALKPKSGDFWAAADRLRKELEASGRKFTDSTELIRQDRDSR